MGSSRRHHQVCFFLSLSAPDVCGQRDGRGVFKFTKCYFFKAAYALAVRGFAVDKAIAEHYPLVGELMHQDDVQCLQRIERRLGQQT